MNTSIGVETPISSEHSGETTRNLPEKNQERYNRALPSLFSTSIDDTKRQMSIILTGMSYTKRHMFSIDTGIRHKK